MDSLFDNEEEDVIRFKLEDDFITNWKQSGSTKLYFDLDSHEVKFNHHGMVNYYFAQSHIIFQILHH